MEYLVEFHVNPLDPGETAHGHRRIVPQTDGTFTGPESAGVIYETYLVA